MNKQGSSSKSKIRPESGLGQKSTTYDAKAALTYNENDEEQIAKHAIEEKQFESSVEYLCYGDLIMLTYTKKIFDKGDGDKYRQQREAEWDGESMDEAQQLLKDDQTRKENVKL